MDVKEATEKDIEATVVQGQTTYVADPYGELQRGLKERHVQFIALGGTIGTGLFLGIGSALATSGPLSLFLGYLFTSVAIWAMMQSLGEMTSLFPLPGMIAQLGSRFVDPALGFAIGWNQWYNCAIAICAETSAAVVLIQYWTDINPAAWITIILAIVVFLNVIAVAIYGEAEFFFAGIKIITILGLLILAFVIDLGGGPSHDRLGFRYWKHPGAMNTYIGTGSTGRFLGLFNTLINAAFAFGGVEQVAVAAGETKDPARNIPKAIRRVFWRLLFFYVLGSLGVGVLVPSTNDHLLYGSGVASSPWLIAINNAGIPVLPHILNAVLVTSAASSANANLYTGSRYLYALAQQGQAPRFLLTCTKRGVPIYCVGITGVIGLLTYMTVSSGGANVFHWFSSLVTIAYLLTWLSICLAYTRFRKALIHAGVDRATLPFRARGQPYTAWGGAGFFAVVLLFNGFPVFTHGNWNARNFVSAYIGLPIFALLYTGWKVVTKSKIVPIDEIDLVTGRVDLDHVVNGAQPRPRPKKLPDLLRRMASKIG
ncbi:AAT family amino acid transporter [Capronia epimyces CBS 606.96]|uniref:AAT family amino acid transporter n=1 Tax=Capronia epimyces CBS 606.96 TaxID=1182542 RepID=W9XYB5_9EURO|nr:AAT family amino acid transporter [Capronia epimyces CBS 606.96]EXJ85253.1 AAT family amino acid transporter [Capronia epimyces CBS 606.96]